MEQRGENLQIHLEVSVDQHVPEAGNTSELTHEIPIEHAEATELVDGAGVIRNIPPLTGDDVRRDVESVLGTKLESALHCPACLGPGIQLVERDRAQFRQRIQRLSKGRQVPTNDLDVDFTRAHDESSVAGRKPARAASIFARCGTKSQ